MAYVPPQAEDVLTEAAPATENHRAPLLARDEEKSHERHTSPVPPAAIQQPRTETGVPVADLLPDAPDVQRMWKAQKHLMALWLGTSIVALFFFSRLFTVWVFYPSFIACLLALTCSTLYLCGRWRAPLSTQIRATVTLGTVSAVLDTWNAILTFMVVFAVDCDDSAVMDCRAFIGIFTIFGIYLVWHGWLSAHISSKGKDAMRMLNPVSSGMVSVAV